MYLASRVRGDRHAVCWSHGYIILGPRRSPIDLFFFLTNLRWQIVSCWEKGVVRLAQYRYGVRLNSSTGKSPSPPVITRALTLPNFELISKEITCNSKEIHVYAYGLQYNSESSSAFLNFCVSYRWVVSFMPRPLYCRLKSRWSRSCRWLGDPQVCTGFFREDTNLHFICNWIMIVCLTNA